MDEEILRRHLEYQIMADYVMCGYDRHLNNIGLLRDPDTLKIKGVAPIFDSGGSFYAQKRIPDKYSEILELETNSFCQTEQKLINLVRDPSVIDLSKLPDSSRLRDLYSLDPHMTEKDKNRIGEIYETKIDLCRKFQQGKNIR